jgi:hypothetical protein
MSLPETESLPIEPEPISEPVSEPAPAQPAPQVRRRVRRGLVPYETEQRAAFFGELIHLATPSADFFLFSGISGLVAGLALLLNSPALFFLAALLAPFMAPVLGLAVSAAIGNLRFFGRSLAALVIGSVLVFFLGGIAGWISLNVSGLIYTQALFHTTFSWPDLLVIILGAAFTAYLSVRSGLQRPLVSSVAVAYELFVPLTAAGFGLTQPAVAGLFPEGLVLFASNLALAAVTATFVLILLKIRPLPSGNHWIVSLALLVGLTAAALFGIGSALLAGPVMGQVALMPSATVTPTLTPRPSHTFTPQPSPSSTAIPPTPSDTPTSTLVPTATPTITVTPSPTPVYGLVNAGELNGVIIRPEPGSMLISTTLLNGSVVEILPEVVNKNGFIWIHVRAPDGKEGWVQSGLIVTATPRPR